MKKSTPGSLHLLHPVIAHGNFTGDEALHILNHIEVIDNYVYIDNVNTGVNVKGDPGEPGKSAYESYVEICESQGITPLSEQEWVDTLETVTYIGSGAQSDYEEIDSTDPSYIWNKPLVIERDDGTYDITFT